MTIDDDVHRTLLAELSAPPAAATLAPADVGPAPVDRAAIVARVRALAPLLDDAEVGAAADRVAARMHGLGRLDALLAQPGVTDVCVNGTGPVWVERDGRLQPTDVVVDDAEVRHLVERIVGPLGLRADRRHPLVDGRLPDGSRVHIAMPPLAVDGPYVTIRRFAARTLAVEAFTSPAVAAHLVDAVQRCRSIVVSGGTGAGKTTLLNALCQHLPPATRIVTIEDAAELALPGDHVVRLEARAANADGLGASSIRDLVRNALRMRPDRLVVGEVRGAEALDLVQALNTGHRGSLSTCHANGPVDALHRLETMALTAGVGLPLAALRAQLARAVDLVVHVERHADGRRIAAIDRVPDHAVDTSSDHGGWHTHPLVRDGQVIDDDEAGW